VIIIRLKIAEIALYELCNNGERGNTMRLIVGAASCYSEITACYWAR
jgi:hypothetical protein